jgi:hyperosmotically inducible periplasmic protein
MEEWNMKKLTPFLLGSLLLFGVAACNDVAKTSADAPNSTERVGNVPDADSAQTTQRDANRDVRDAQIQADERVRQQRNQAAGNDAEIADGDVESLVRNRLEKQLPSGNLAVDSEEGVVTISGTVTSKADLDRIDEIAQEVQGVKSVKVNATVAQPTQ